MTNSTTPKPKSRSAIEEELRVATLIASAVQYTAHIRVGPHEKYTTRDLPSYEAAVEEADRLTRDHGTYGRKAVVFAVNAKGIEEMCTPELVALARTLL